MSTTIRGTAILKFGCHTLSGYITQDEDLNIKGDEFVIQDETGQVVTYIEKFGLRNDNSITFIPLSGTARPALGDSITFNSVVCTLKDFRARNNNKGVEVWTLVLTNFPGITFT